MTVVQTILKQLNMAVTDTMSGPTISRQKVVMNFRYSLRLYVKGA